MIKIIALSVDTTMVGSEVITHIEVDADDFDSKEAMNEYIEECLQGHIDNVVSASWMDLTP